MDAMTHDLARTPHLRPSSFEHGLIKLVSGAARESACKSTAGDYAAARTASPIGASPSRTKGAPFEPRYR